MQELLTELQDEQDPFSLKEKSSPDGKGILKLKRGELRWVYIQIREKILEVLNLRIQGEDTDIYPEMGCYGIGASRIVAMQLNKIMMKKE